MDVNVQDNLRMYQVIKIHQQNYLFTKTTATICTPNLIKIKKQGKCVNDNINK